jgi:hypothetical protein
VVFYKGNCLRIRTERQGINTTLLHKKLEASYQGTSLLGPPCSGRSSDRYDGSLVSGHEFIRAAPSPKLGRACSPRGHCERSRVPNGTAKNFVGQAFRPDSRSDEGWFGAFAEPNPGERMATIPSCLRRSIPCRQLKRKSCTPTRVMLSVRAKHPSARISPRDGHRAESYVGKRRERMFSWSAADLLPLLRCREGHGQVAGQGEAAVSVDD